MAICKIHAIDKVRFLTQVMTSSTADSCIWIKIG